MLRWRHGGERGERVRSEAARGRGAGALEAVGPELAQLCVVVLWASTFVVTKGAFAEIDPLAFVFVRFALMTALAFAVLAARGKAWRVRRADLPRFAAAGLSGYTLYQLGFVLGLERTSPFSSSLMIALVPLFTIAILALRREPTAATAWLGIGVAIAGWRSSWPTSKGRARRGRCWGTR